MDGFLKKCAERERYGAWSQEEACWSSVRLRGHGGNLRHPSLHDNHPREWPVESSPQPCPLPTGTQHRVWTCT